MRRRRSRIDDDRLRSKASLAISGKLDSPLARSAHDFVGIRHEHPTFVAVVDGTLAGFCAVQLEASEALLDHLWVVPSFMGRCVGRALFLHAAEIARASGAIRMKIVGDSYAERFYSCMNATLYGRESAS